MIQKYVQNMDIKSKAIVVMTIIIILLIVFWPSHPPQDPVKQMYYDTIEALFKERALNRATITELFKASEIKDERTSLIVGILESKIEALEKKLSTQRQKIQPIVQDNPELESYLATQDSLQIATKQKADSLQSALDFQVGVVKQLQTLVIDKDKIQSQMYTVCSAQLDKVERKAQNETNRKRGWKKVAGVLGVIVVVETLLILAE